MNRFIERRANSASRIKPPGTKLPLFQPAKIDRRFLVHRRKIHKCVTPFPIACRLHV